MPEEIINKLHTALRHISPLASDREKIISEMGEVIWFETLEKILDALPVTERDQVVAFLNEDKLEEAIKVCALSAIDIEAILVATAQDVLNEVSKF